MKCHILFSEKNEKNISKCCLLKILPRVLSVKGPKDYCDLCCSSKSTCTIFRVNTVKLTLDNNNDDDNLVLYITSNII